VTVSAEEWAQSRKRITYLEAVLVQVLQGKSRVKEWFSSADLTALKLPGLPTTKAALTRFARSAGWLSRQEKGRGGLHFEYHFYSLPQKAFDSLISRVMTSRSAAPQINAEHQVSHIPEPVRAKPEVADNAMPACVLPLMRVIKSKTPATLGEALDMLPAHLPSGVGCPTAEEAIAILRKIGVMS
jgi:Mu DNA-binding domain